jgi:DNA polymerase-3 subunit beta
MSALIFERDALWPALQGANKVVERKNIIPILGNILMRSVGGKASVAATDLDIWSETIVPVAGLTFGEDFAATIPGASLHDLVRKFPEGAQVSFTFSDTNVVIRSGKARFTLPTLPGQDFPLTLAEMTGECAFSAPAKGLARILATTDFAQNRTNERQYLNGIYLHPVTGAENMMLRAVATDGHRLARDQIELPDGAERMPGVILPPKFINEATRLLAQGKGGEACELDVATNKIRVTYGATTIISKLVAGTYPDYQRIVPNDHPHALLIDKQALVATTDRIATVTSEAKRSMRLELDADRATLSAQDPNGSAATDEIEAEWEGPPAFVIGCNIRYLLDILGAMEADTLFLRMAEPRDAILLEAREGSAAQFILMPTQVSS